jgi:hypothetical protein
MHGKPGSDRENLRFVALGEEDSLESKPQTARIEHRKIRGGPLSYAPVPFFFIREIRVIRGQELPNNRHARGWCTAPTAAFTARGPVNVRRNSWGS